MNEVEPYGRIMWSEVQRSRANVEQSRVQQSEVEPYQSNVQSSRAMEV